MSFDIVVLKPRSSAVLLSLEDVEEVDVLGNPSEIRRNLNQISEQLEWSTDTFGHFLASEGFALEFSLPSDPQPTSLHVTLHFGERWEDGGSEAFDEIVSEWFERFGWQAFATSDNSSLLVQPDE